MVSKNCEHEIYLVILGMCPTIEEDCLNDPYHLMQCQHLHSKNIAKEQEMFKLIIDHEFINDEKMKFQISCPDHLLKVIINRMEQDLNFIMGDIKKIIDTYNNLKAKYKIKYKSQNLVKTDVDMFIRIFLKICAMLDAYNIQQKAALQLIGFQIINEDVLLTEVPGKNLDNVEELGINFEKMTVKNKYKIRRVCQRSEDNN